MPYIGNGTDLRQFACMNQLEATNTFFRKRDIYKYIYIWCANTNMPNLVRSSIQISNRLLLKWQTKAAVKICASLHRLWLLLLAKFCAVVKVYKNIVLNFVYKLHAQMERTHKILFEVLIGENHNGSNEKIKNIFIIQQILEKRIEFSLSQCSLFPGLAIFKIASNVVIS